MLYEASLTGEGSGPHDDEATGSPTDEVGASLEYNAEIADDPDDVRLPELPGVDVPVDELESLGVTWQLATNDVDAERVRDGPPV